MNKLYTAVGRMQFKRRNQGARCPIVILKKQRVHFRHPGNDPLVYPELADPLRR